jgi:hypothetical protein
MNNAMKTTRNKGPHFACLPSRVPNAALSTSPPQSPAAALPFWAISGSSQLLRSQLLLYAPAVVCCGIYAMFHSLLFLLFRRCRFLISRLMSSVVFLCLPPLNV